jgi:hypothetical protein
LQSCEPPINRGRVATDEAWRIAPRRNSPAVTIFLSPNEGIMSDPLFG